MEKRSIIHRYRFPAQEHAIDRARGVRDPKTQKSAGQLVGIDERERFVYLKRGATSQVPHPTALIPSDIIGTQVLRDSLLRFGSWVADHRIDALGHSVRREISCSTGPRVCGARR